MIKNIKEQDKLKEEIKKLKTENKKLSKLREKELNTVREQVKREVELESIAKRIINFIKSNGVEVIVYPKLPILLTVKKIDTEFSEEENYGFLIKFNDFVNLNLNTLSSTFLRDSNEKDEWVYSVIQTSSSLEDNLTLMKYLVRLSEKEELIDIHDKAMWEEKLYNSILEK